MNDRSARGSVGCFYWLEINGVYGLRENMHWGNIYGAPPFGETDKGGVAPSDEVPESLHFLLKARLPHLDFLLRSLELRGVAR